MRNPFKKRTTALPVDRYTGVLRSARSRRSRLAFLKRKWVLVTLAVLLCLGSLGGYVWYLYKSLEGDIQVDLPPVKAPDKETDPFNVLLVGSDSRAGLTEDEQQKLAADDETPEGARITGERADTLILAHIDPETKRVTMIQFPRDLYVPLPQGGKSKINETLEEGRNHLIETFKGVTGLEVNHYAEVNIAGFRDLVNAIDGVEVCITEPIPFDPNTGIEVAPEDVGMVEFDADKALRFVRSRNFATGDFERIQNQQKFLAAAINKITSPLTFLNFRRLLEVKEVAGRNVRIDSQTSLLRLHSILRRFRAFDPDNYEAYTVPNFGIDEVRLDSGAALSVVRPDPTAMKVMFDAIDNNESPAAADGTPDVNASDISVGIYNGTRRPGFADRAADRLVEATTTAKEGVDVLTVTDAQRRGFKRTLIEYRPGRPGAEAEARLVAAAIPGAKIQKGKTSPGIDLAVTIGRDFSTARIVQISPLPIPKPTELPEECR